MQFKDCLWMKSIYHQPFILHRVGGVLEPILVVIGYTLGRSQAQFVTIMICRVKQPQTLTATPMGNLNLPNMHVFLTIGSSWRNPHCVVTATVLITATPFRDPCMEKSSSKDRQTHWPSNKSYKVNYLLSHSTLWRQPKVSEKKHVSSFFQTLNHLQ